MKSIFLIHQYGVSKFTILMSVIITFTIIDMVFSNAASITSVVSNWELGIFIVTGAVYGIGQYLILDFIRHKSRQIITKFPHLQMLNTIVRAIQYLLTALIVLTIFELVLTSHYHTAILTWGTTINYALATLIMGLLALRFISWYKLNRSFLVLLYALSATAIAIGLIILLVFNAVELMLIAPVRDAQSSPAPYVLFDQTKPMGILQYDSAVADFVPALLLWVSSAALLHHYTQRLGKVKFWTIMSIPIVFFVFQPVVLGPTLAGAQLPSYLTIIGAILPGVSGGILFGVPFFAVARSIPRGSVLRDYLIIAGWGFILFNVTTSAGVQNAPYFPFGFASVLFTVLACYLILIGVYSSAISASEDARLRQSIRSSVVKESKLLGEIGMAQMEQEIQRRVIKVAKEHEHLIVEQTGVEPTMTDEEIKDYMTSVISELTKRSPQKDGSTKS